MQTTLLGIAIALILALVAALVGPHFVDWNRYRAEFESQASRLTGLTVNINGAVEARLLPIPALTLGQIEMARPGETGALRARKLGIEFSLSALMRGEWRASEVRLEGAEVTAGLDDQGRLDWPALSAGLDLDSISIERLDIVDSRATLVDDASGGRFVLDKLAFRGELRSLRGPVKGEGSFVLGGVNYPYSVATGRAGDNGVRVRLNLEPVDRPLIADADAVVVMDHGVPRFEGSLQLARPVGRAPEGIVQPWRVTSRIHGDSSAAVLEQIEFQYGPDDRALKLRGDARLTFGRNSLLELTLASTQIDLDRLLDLPEASRKRPLVAVKSFADAFGAAQRPPIPVKLGVSIENVTLGGAMLQRVSGEVVGDADSWNLDLLEFRAPGATQVGLSGRLNLTGSGIAFDGRAKVEARDPRALAAWLSDRVDVQTISAGALRAEGDVKLGGDRIAIDGLSADIDRMTMKGSLAYAWASGDRPPRIDAALTAPDIDLDRLYALVQGALADTPFEWPREGKLSFNAGRAAVAGVEARRADIDVTFDRRGLDITRLVIGDFGGATLTMNGHIDTGTQAPRGSVTLDFDARALDGIATLVEKIAPQAVTEFRRRAARFVPAKVKASLTVSGEAPARPATALFRIDGSAGAFKVNLQGQTDAPAESLTLETLSRLDSAKLNLTGRLEAGDGSALVDLLGLDSLLAVDKRPGRLTLTANGPLNGDMSVDGQFVAGGLDLSTKGNVRLMGGHGPTAGVAIRVANANLRSLRPVAAGQPSETLPVAVTANLKLAEGSLDVADIAGKAAGTEIGGRLKVGLARPFAFSGALDVGEINLSALIAAAIGTPVHGGPAVVWPAEPFEQGLLGNFSGKVVVQSAHVALTPRLAVKNVRSVVRLDPGELAFEEIDGTMAGGRLGGELYLRRGADGVTAHSRLSFAGADVAELIRGGPPPLSGHVTGEIDVEGAGRSPIALVGSLKGSGSFTLQDGQIQRLDPGAFDAVIRSVDQGLPIDSVRIRDRMEQALATGALPVTLAEGQIAIADGQVWLAKPMVRAQGADLAVGGNVVLTEEALDVKLVLSGPARPDAPGGTRPELTIALKGPTDAPKRTLDVAALSNWLALRTVEQQKKRIDALESGREINPPPVREPEASPPPVVTTPAPPPRAARTQTAPQRPRPPAQPSGPSAKSNSAPQQPLDLRPPASRGNSLLESWFGR